jgi:hypothetical protein
MTRPTDRDAQGAALPRRTRLLGAGAASAALVVAKAVPVAPTEVADAAARAVADGQAGYRLSPHVLRYYETAKV